MRKFCDLDPGRFKVIQGQRSWCQSIAHWWFPIWLPLSPTLYLSRQSRYLPWKFCDLELGWFEVNQGQRWWHQSTAHGWLPIRRLLTPTSHLWPFKIFECNFDELPAVQGHPRSKVKLPIDSPWVISYSTSIDPIIVSVTIFLYIW